MCGGETLHRWDLQCAVAILLRSIWCCMRVEFPASERIWDLLAICISFPILYHIITIAIEAILLDHLLLCVSSWDLERHLHLSCCRTMSDNCVFLVGFYTPEMSCFAINKIDIAVSLKEQMKIVSKLQKQFVLITKWRIKVSVACTGWNDYRIIKIILIWSFEQTQF